MSGELLHVAVRAAVAYLVLLALVRASGKRTVAQGTPFDFVLALILGDMVDDLLWGDVPAAGFVVAVGTLTLAHTLVAPPYAATSIAAHEHPPAGRRRGGGGRPRRPGTGGHGRPASAGD
jgi:hypothetical protein